MSDAPEAMTLKKESEVDWDIEADIVVVGSGGCGMTAALAAAQQGAETILLEKERRIGGNTALSTGMIPAAGSRLQRQAGIQDSVEAMAADIQAKNRGGSDPDLTLHLCRQSAALVEWLMDHAGVTLELVTDFKYPGQSCCRMHAPPARTGAALTEQLWRAVQNHDRIEPVLSAPACGLVVDDAGGVTGVVVQRSGTEYIRSGKVILALSGFGANRRMVERYCPEISTGEYGGVHSNTGEGIEWGTELGAATDNMDAYQGHGSVAFPHGTLVTWAVVVNGGFLVNRQGLRFGNESEGYSEYAVKVLRQTDRLAFMIFDDRIYQSVLPFADFRTCVEAGAVIRAETPESLADQFHIDRSAFAATIEAVHAVAAGGRDPFGRPHFAHVLESPFYGVQVTGALFHTQGGLRVDKRARVMRPDGRAIENLYAGGGTAAGVSGAGAAGYIAGNGLLTALGWGKIAGDDAGASFKRP